VQRREVLGDGAVANELLRDGSLITPASATSSGHLERQDTHEAFLLALGSDRVECVLDNVAQIKVDLLERLDARL
jgi:hypothetical protein